MREDEAFKFMRNEAGTSALNARAAISLAVRNAGKWVPIPGNNEYEIMFNGETYTVA